MRFDTQLSDTTDTQTAVTISEPILKDSSGDTSKRWYIEYLITDPALNIQKRQREWISVKLNAEERHEVARQLIKEIKERYKGKKVPVIEEEEELPRNILRIQKILVSVIDTTVLRDKSKSTYKTCVYHLCRFLKDSKIREVKDITKERATDFLNAFTLVYNANTVKNTLNHLKATFSEAIRKKVITKNPFLGIKLNISKEDGDFNTPFNDYEKEAIENYLEQHDYRLYLFTRFVFYAFLRPKELRNIKVGDIDLKLKTIKVKAEVSKTNSRDTIPILKPLYKLIIENKLLNYPSHYYLFGKNLVPAAQKLPANFATSEHKKVLEKLGIYKEKITTLYAWKHTGNIAAYLAGLDIKMIQRINRHKSLATTEIYLKKLGLFLDKTVFDFSF